MQLHIKTREIFLKVIDRNKNFFPIFQKKTLLAYSGGKDSTLLLHYYLFLSEMFYFPRPALFHLQHLIRNNAEQEKKIYEYMQSLNLEIYFYKKNIPKISKKIGKTLEETGRFVRYALLNKIAKKQNWIIATAHHTLDYLESVFIHLIRGGGKSSFSTLPILHENLFRPLILFHYSEIQEILSLENWNIFEDESNYEETYLRNRIRKQIIPLFLKEGLNLEKLYKNFHEENLYSFNPTSKLNLGYVKIFLPKSLSISELKQILDSYLKYLKLYPITYKVLQEIYRQLNNSNVVYVTNREAIFWKSKKNILYIIPKFSEVLKKPKIIKNKLIWNQKIYTLDLETLCENRIGKKIIFKFGHKAVSEILRENNVPTPVRDNIPILEKNGFLTKILISFWDEDLKDIQAYEKRVQN